ncbi:HAD family hydrolase [Rudaeicoccus suwonensis]|uniref:2-haloacid dehalogenase n=1 Tax=Rudaeicoccus suwonensis TaxID=657409 RepID=A0A561EAB9_9MICO|nr:HAD family phosphatase [Rudaeicoccus suwonensis]TWE12537.1 2-haloacid dehalogenase [Rudaeicoccus suwonensis]
MNPLSSDATAPASSSPHPATDESPSGADSDDFAPAPVDAVVFDLGNVLIAWDPLPAIAAGVGMQRAEAFLADFDFAGWNLAQDSGRTFADGEAAAIATHPHYEAEIRSYRTHFEASLRGQIDGTVALLHELKAADVPLFALTNWAEETFPVALDRFDFLEAFEDIIVSGEEGVAKPDPEIFEVLEERIRHIGGLDDCIFIDDNLANVHAATMAGLDAIAFTTPDELRADLLVRGLPVAAN